MDFNFIKKIAFAFFMCSNTFFAFSQESIVIAESKHNYNLNPRTATYATEAQILTGLYEGLFSYDPVTLEPLYAMAESYRIARDKKRWTFVLKDDLKFSDGSKITAETVRNSFIKVLETPSAPYSSLLDIIQGAQELRTLAAEITFDDFQNLLTAEENLGIYAVDEKTISFYLKTPASHLPRLLCMPCFSVTDENLSLFSGPFCISEQSEDKIILLKNQNYWDLKNTKLDKITILLSSDEKENVYGFNNGTIDWIASSFEEKTLIEKNAIQVSAEFATQYFFFKFSKDSVFNNLNLRKALMEATPWDKLRANTYVQAKTLIYSLNGYPTPEGYSFTDDFEAKLLMKQARKELNLSEDEKITIRFAITDSDYMKEKAKVLKDAWESLGVELETILFSEFAYLSNIQKTDAELFTYNWIGDFADPLAFLELFRGNSTLNVTNWHNEEFDSLLDEAALYTDENHNKLLSKAEQLLLDEAVIFPIQHPVSVNIINLNEIAGWSVNAFDLHPFKYIFKRAEKTEDIQDGNVCKLN